MTPVNAPHMTESMREQMAEARKLDAAIEDNLKEFGYDG